MDCKQEIVYEMITAVAPDAPPQRSRRRGSLPSKHAEVSGHFQLAEALLAAAKIKKDESSEVGVRRALSTGYYALLHVCNAWLAMKNVPLSRRGQHNVLRDELAKKRGPEAASGLNKFFLIRKDADYNPRMFQSKPYFGDFERFRVLAIEILEEMRIEFEQYAPDIRKLLNEGRK